MSRFYLLTALFLLIASPLRADEGQERRVFSIYGVHVDVTSKTALAARTDALNLGVRHAFLQLVEKLVDSDTASSFTKMENADLSALVQSIEVVEEKTSSTRYLGDLNIGFSPEKVREWFALNGLQYSEIEGSTHLVLPVLKQHGGYRLWSDANKWWQAWQKENTQNNLLRYAMPARDFADQMAVGAISLWSNDIPVATDEIISKYNAKSLLVVRGELKHSAKLQRQVLEFSYRKDGDVPLAGNGVIVSLKDDTVDQMMQRAAEAIRWRMDQQWKAQTRTDFAHSLSLVAECETQIASDLVAIRRALENVSIINAIEIDQIGVPVSTLKISFTGSLQQLQLALGQAKLSLYKRPTGSWFLGFKTEN